MNARKLVHWLYLGAGIFLIRCDAPGNEQPTYPRTVYDRYITHPEPAGGIAVPVNSPILRWPIDRKARTYDVRLAQDSTFRTAETIYEAAIGRALFNPHQQLSAGRWYWQYRVSDGVWSTVHAFEIGAEATLIVSPPAARLLAGIPSGHPRVLADSRDAGSIRALAASDDALAIIHEADLALKTAIPSEADGLPSEIAKDADRNLKLRQDASKRLGDFAYQSVISLSQAYLLTEDPLYRLQAMRIANAVANWDPNGISRRSDFGDARCMLAMAIVYDTFHGDLAATELNALRQAIAHRAGNFYTTWLNDMEAKMLSGHVWQHILHYFFQTGIAVYGEIPEAADWLEYAYELFVGRAPILGGADGGWIEGASYFRMNMETLLDIPLYIKKYTGFDFINAHPWYVNNIDWLLYHVPPGSSADGFGDNTEEIFSPGAAYIAYATSLAKLTGSPKAAWYAEACRGYEGADLTPDKSLRWIGLTKLRHLPLPELPQSLKLETGKVFREVGLAALHSQPDHTPENLVVAMRSSPFGSYGHFLSDQNAFNILFGGKRAFFRTGYKVTMKDPHRTGWYQHTKSTNGILIDGAGQPYSTEAYGVIPLFLKGKTMAYVKGDASAAYRSIETGEDYGLRKFYRHLVLLKPSIVVVYDELQADRPVNWSWLIHSMGPMAIDTAESRFSAQFDGFSGIGKLWSAAALSWNLTDTFAVRAENWRGSKNQHGQLKTYDDEQWHLRATNGHKASAIRFLAVLQVGKTIHPHDIGQNDRQGTLVVTAGDWEIVAQLDTAQAPNLSITNRSGTTAFMTNANRLSLAGKTFHGKLNGSAKLAEVTDGLVQYSECADELPIQLKQRILSLQNHNEDE